MRNSRNLNREEIREIISLHGQGCTQTEIAAQFGIDRSTVHYHLNKWDRSYPEEESVYAVLKAQVRLQCAHPSARCVFCGQMWDGLVREERAKISSLTKQVARLHTILMQNGIDVE